MDETKYAIGARFAEERKRVGLTQGVLANVCGVDRKTIGNVERGQNAPSAELLMHVAEQGMDVQYVLTGVRSLNSDEVAKESGSYSLSPSELAKRSLSLAIEVSEEMGLELTSSQLQALTGFAFDRHANKEMLREFVKAAYAVAGLPLPAKTEEQAKDGK